MYVQDIHFCDSIASVVHSTLGKVNAMYVYRHREKWEWWIVLILIRRYGNDCHLYKLIDAIGGLTYKMTELKISANWIVLQLTLKHSYSWPVGMATFGLEIAVLSLCTCTPSTININCCPTNRRSLCWT